MAKETPHQGTRNSVYSVVKYIDDCSIINPTNSVSPCKTGRFRIPARTASCSALLKRRESGLMLLEKRRSRNNLTVEIPQVGGCVLLSIQSLLQEEHKIVCLMMMMLQALDPNRRSSIASQKSNPGSPKKLQKQSSSLRLIQPSLVLLSPVISQQSSLSTPSPPITAQVFSNPPIRGQLLNIHTSIEIL